MRCSRPVKLLSLFPTLVKLCGLPVREGLEGTSVVPLLNDPSAPWEPPAVTTFGQNNHAVRSDHYRYIRYADRSEELYDHRTDSHEWTNLAADPALAHIIREHAEWVPDVNVAPAQSEANNKRKQTKTSEKQNSLQNPTPGGDVADAFPHRPPALGGDARTIPGPIERP